MERPKIIDNKYWDGVYLDKEKYYKEIEWYLDYLEQQLKGEEPEQVLNTCCNCGKDRGDSQSKHRCQDCYEDYMEK